MDHFTKILYLWIISQKYCPLSTQSDRDPPWADSKISCSQGCALIAFSVVGS